MRAIALDRLWRDAVTVACAKRATRDEAGAVAAKVLLGQSQCPFDMRALCTEELDLAAAITKLPQR